ncbi:outer membrane beta-barrel protein [candidate division WOR-3 bacterium]|nr:outer membrane beta-barrel protein [candidate division WOR-3 bacterium]
MKKFMIVVLVVLSFSLPLKAFGPTFGIRGGMDMQIFGNGTSESEWWPSFGALAELNLPLMPISFRGDVGYAFHTEEDVTSSDLSIIVSGKYSISPPLSPIGFYLGVGPGFHLLKVGDLDSKSYFGAHVYAGLDLKMGLNVFVEGGYGMIFPDEGSWSQVVVRGGMRL